MYDVVFDGNNPFGSRLALEKPGAALVILPSAEPGGGGLQRLDVRAEFLAKLLRWHGSAVDLDKWSRSENSGLDPNVKDTLRENAWLARETMDQMLRALTSVSEMATFERRSIGSWNPDLDEFELPSWSECLALARHGLTEPTSVGERSHDQPKVEEVLNEDQWKDVVEMESDG
jgi:hypothetical protein